MSIWFERPDPDALNRLHQSTAVAQLGIAITEVGDDYLRGTMPIDERTRQPMGLLHGGASALFAETLASAAAIATVDSGNQYCVGTNLSAHHVRGVREGSVEGTARPVHLGRASQLWDVEIRAASGKLVCSVRLTLTVIPRTRAQGVDPS